MPFSQFKALVALSSSCVPQCGRVQLCDLWSPRDSHTLTHATSLPKSQYISVAFFSLTACRAFSPQLPFSFFLSFYFCNSPHVCVTPFPSLSLSTTPHLLPLKEGLTQNTQTLSISWSLVVICFLSFFLFSTVVAFCPACLSHQHQTGIQASSSSLWLECIKKKEGAKFAIFSFGALF